jgi:hypothetical protein
MFNVTDNFALDDLFANRDGASGDEIPYMVLLHRL